MDGGVGVAVEAANEELQRTIVELCSEVSVETVEPLVAAFEKAEEGTLIELHIKHNGGGDVTQLFALITAIVHTKAKVEITFGRYIMSAAATLWLWFLLWPVPHVTSLMPLKHGVLMYHRPRKQCFGNSDYYCFAESFKDGDPVKESLLQKIKIFDELFESLLEKLGWSAVTDANLVIEDVGYTHWLQHLKEAYYDNKDCVIPVFPV